MPAYFDVNNGTVDIRFQWNGIETAKAQEIVNYAAFYDWRGGLGPTVEVDGEIVQKPWGDLTNQEKLTMVFEASQRLIITQAGTAYFNAAQIAAQDTAAEYVDEEFILD